MRGINKVFLLGHVGQDPVVRQTSSGKSVCELSIATNRSVRTGETWMEEADWHRIRLWDQRAEVALRYITRGSAIAVEGQLRTDTWTDAQQVRHTKSYVLVDQLHLLPLGKPRDDHDRPAHGEPSPQDGPAVNDGLDDANIPF